MNIAQLKAQLDGAIERGIDPTTAVVVDLQERPEHDWFWELEITVKDPTVDDGFIWYTLTPSECADCRTTPAHYREEEDESSTDN